MIDRDHMQALTETYMGPAAYKKHLAKLRAHAEKLRDMEDRNDHSGYVVYLAKLAKDKGSTQAAKAFEVLHEYFGGITMDMVKLRQRISDRAWKSLEARWDFHNVDKFKEML